MKLSAKWLYALLVLALLVWSCGKDKKTTNPEDTLPSVSATLGEDELVFHAYAAVFVPSLEGLIIAFTQLNYGDFPISTIAIEETGALEEGEPVVCHALITTGAEDIYGCGDYADDAEAVATITFSELSLTQGGQVSGHIEGMVEHSGYPEEDLISFEFDFANITVTVD